MPRPRKTDDLQPIFTLHNMNVPGARRTPLRRVSVQRVGSGIYSVSTAEISREARMRAFASSIPGSVISSFSAAQLYGFRFPPQFIAGAEVYLHTLSAQRVRRQGIKQLRSMLSPSEYTEIDGVLITTPERTFLDLGLTISARQLVYVADGLLVSPRRRHNSLVKFDSLLEYVLSKKYHRGKQNCLEALELAEVGSDSVKETELRLLLRDFGILNLTVNPVLRTDSGEYVCEPDLADFSRKVSIQYEGAHHGTLRQMRLDDERRARTEAIGWVEVKIFAADLQEYAYFQGDAVPKAVWKVLNARGF